jgi:protein tyrosine/serine phosphatase
VRLDWPGCVNARDVGGLSTADGGRIRPGALLRSDHHAALTPAGLRAVRDCGVSRILDLRRARECDRDPSPFAGDPVYRHVPLLAPVREYEIDPYGYGPLLDHNRARIRVAYAAFAEAPPGAVLVHCQGGRDRTGALVAVALAAAGVPAADIVADYARTDGSPPATMSTTLRHLDDVYGGAAAYLLAAGVTPAQLSAGRARLLSW